MKTQLFVGRKKPTQSFFDPKKSSYFHPNKPWGGFWTSTYNKEIGSDWIDWCLHNSYPYHKIYWLLEPSPFAKILTINSSRDLYDLFKTFGENITAHTKTLKWAEISTVYDAVHVTHRGLHATNVLSLMRKKSAYPDFEKVVGILGLYGWDCESTVWLSHKFLKVRRLSNITFPEGNLTHSKFKSQLYGIRKEMKKLVYSVNTTVKEKLDAL